MRTFETKIPFMVTLLENEELMKYFTQDDIEKLFTYDEIFKSVDYIFNRCGIV
jgi:adenylosuccinate lyase